MSPTAPGQAEYWDAVVATKRFAHPVDVARLATLVGRDARIVELGCGHGRVLELLAEHGFRHLIGFDTSEKMIAAARHRLPEARLEWLRTPTLSLDDASVDAVLLIALLTCVPSDVAQRQIMREVERVLRPGGIVYISDLWLQDDARNRRRYEEGAPGFDRHGVFRLPEGVVLRHHDREWIEEITAAFERIALEEISVQTMNDNTAKGFQFLGRRRGRLDEALMHRTRLA